MNYSSLDPELADTSISLNDDSNKENETKKLNQQMKEKNDNHNNNQGNSSFFMNLFQSKRKELISSLITQAQDKGKSWYEKRI